MDDFETITRPQFDSMNPAARTRYIRSGGQVIDPPENNEVSPERVLPESTITRRHFDALAQVDRAAHVRSGGQVVDA